METVEEVRGVPSVTLEAASLAGEFLIFRLGAEEYGIDILQVQEIRSYEAPTSIANAPAFIKGVINLRGVIVPILDLRLKFALKSEYNALTVVIVLNVGRRVVGMVVDAVSDVLPLGHPQIRPVPDSTHVRIPGSSPVSVPRQVTVGNACLSSLTSGS